MIYVEQLSEDYLLLTIVSVMLDDNVFTGEHFPTIVIWCTLINYYSMIITIKFPYVMHKAYLSFDIDVIFLINYVTLFLYHA